MGQLNATRAAAMRLATSHVDLAKAELSEILDELKMFAVAAGIVFALALFAGLLVTVGGTLFVGEWLFGSIGWGVLHGVELSIAISVTSVLAVLGLPGRTIGRWFLIALAIGVVLAIVLGLDLTNEGWKRVGDAAFTGLAPESRLLVVAAVALAIAGGVIGLLLGALDGGGAGGAILGLVLGLILGLVVGAFTAITFGARVGAAVGVAVGLIVWPAGAADALRRQGVDVDAIKSRLWPTQTITTTKETIEWVREQTPLGRKS